ncbi:hypothetical protein GGX14DRAFT_396053 [Mycena pura]|uniref:Uncharacterized protein n=1 Tax=Mycena pura TaxID=153505 RepID=A0AAD6VBC2_9AGAR|nr:hypothetical protein GGX14DRAFT_396053 [Mycena pura]
MSALATASLVEALLESVLYGVYGVLCITVLYLFRSRERRPAVWVSLSLVIQFFTITGHWIGTQYATLFAFVHLGGGDAAAAFYENLSAPWYLANLVFLGASFLITNLLVIHRVHVIFSNSRTVIVLPFIFLVVQVVSEVVLLYQFAKSHPGEQYIVLYGSACTVQSILAIIAESAALYTAISIGALVTYHVGFVGQVVFTGISPVVMGISTILIYARIGLGWAHGSDTARGGYDVVRSVVNDHGVPATSIGPTVQARDLLVGLCLPGFGISIFQHRACCDAAAPRPLIHPMPWKGRRASVRTDDSFEASLRGDQRFGSTLASSTKCCGYFRWLSPELHAAAERRARDAPGGGVWERAGFSRREMDATLICKGAAFLCYGPDEQNTHINRYHRILHQVALELALWPEIEVSERLGR